MPTEHEDNEKLTTIVKSSFEIIDDFVYISMTNHDDKIQVFSTPNTDIHG